VIGEYTDEGGGGGGGGGAAGVGGTKYPGAKLFTRTIVAALPEGDCGRGVLATIKIVLMSSSDKRCAFMKRSFKSAGSLLMIDISFTNILLNAKGSIEKVIIVPINMGEGAILNLLHISRGAIDWTMSYAFVQLIRVRRLFKSLTWLALG